jgi:hypothetical protein
VDWETTYLKNNSPFPEFIASEPKDRTDRIKIDSLYNFRGTSQSIFYSDPSLYNLEDWDYSPKQLINPFRS